MESPDVETPGLLVKALISSFFMVVVVAHLTNIFFKILLSVFLNSSYFFIAPCKYSRKKAYEQEVLILLSGYFLIFPVDNFFHFIADKLHQLFNVLF